MHPPRGHQLTRFISNDLPAWSGDHLLDSTGESGTTANTAFAGDLKLLTGYYLPALARFAPYFERACLRSLTPWVSSEPRTMW